MIDYFLQKLRTFYECRCHSIWNFFFFGNIKLIDRIPHSNISTATSAILQSICRFAHRRKPLDPSDKKEPTNVSVSRGKIVTRLSNYGILHHEQLSTKFPEGHVSFFKRSVSSKWSMPSDLTRSSVRQHSRPTYLFKVLFTSCITRYCVRENTS